MLTCARPTRCSQNFTNPGAISHNEILQLYKDYVDPEFEWSNFTVEEQAKVGRRCSGSAMRGWEWQLAGWWARPHQRPGYEHCCGWGPKAGSLHFAFACPGLLVAHPARPAQPAAQVIVAPRSNNLLDTARIEGEFPEILPIKESLIKWVGGPRGWGVGVYQTVCNTGRTVLQCLLQRGGGAHCTCTTVRIAAIPPRALPLLPPVLQVCL